MRPVFKPDSVLYASLIKSQLNSINPKLYKVQFYFNEMKKQRVCLSDEHFRSLFELVIPNWVEIAEFLVRDGLEKIEFDEGSYCFVISCYVKHGFCKHAILVAERARIRSVKPNLEFYSCVMSVYRLSGDARAAVEMFLEMKERGVVANEGIYKILLEILCGVKWMKLCCVILEEMRVVGYKVDEHLAVDLMRIIVEVEMVAEAGCFIKEGVLIGNESLGVFVEGMVKKGNPLVAIEMKKSIKDLG